MIACMTRKPVDVAEDPPAKPTTVRTTPTTRKAMDSMNIHRPAVSNVDHRFDICDNIDAPTRPSLSTVEMEDREASVSWAAADDDGRSELPPPLSVSTTASIGRVSIRSAVVAAVALTGDDWIALPDDGEVRYVIPAATCVTSINIIRRTPRHTAERKRRDAGILFTPEPLLQLRKPGASTPPPPRSKTRTQTLPPVWSGV